MSVLSRFKPCSHLTLKYSLCSAVNNRNLSIFFKDCSCLLRNISLFYFDLKVTLQYIQGNLKYNRESFLHMNNV